MPNVRQPKGSSKYAYKPDVGVKTDFETLLQRFAQTGTVRYEAFAKIWKEMKMHLYCAGRQDQREAREFMEDCFRIAIQFCVPPSSFLVRAGGIYLLYGLYHFQLVNPKVKIRISPQHWDTMLVFQEEAREQQHLDLDYIFQSLVIDRAFSFNATTVWCYPTSKETEDVSVISENLKESCNAVEEIFSSSALNQLALIHDQYHKMKVVLNGAESTKPDTSLDIIHQDLINGVYKTLKVHRDRQVSIIQGVAYTKPKVGGEADNEDKLEMMEEEAKMSVKKGLKKKAFKTFKGYKFKGSSDTDGEISFDTFNVKKRANLVKNKVSGFSRGRSSHVNLFEKDDMADMDNNFSEGTEGMKLNLEIPDEDENIVYKSAGDSDSERESAVKKGKAPAKGQAKKKGTKKKSAKANNSTKEDNLEQQQELEESMEEKEREVEQRIFKIEIDLRSDTDKSETESPARKRRPSRNKQPVIYDDDCDDNEFNDFETDEDDITPKKRVKVKQEIVREYELESPEYDQKRGNVSKGGGKKKGAVSKAIEEDEVQEPTAQQKLHQKLAQRAKASRTTKGKKKK